MYWSIYWKVGGQPGAASASASQSPNADAYAAPDYACADGDRGIMSSKDAERVEEIAERVRQVGIGHIGQCNLFRALVGPVQLRADLK